MGRRADLGFPALDENRWDLTGRRVTRHVSSEEGGHYVIRANFISLLLASPLLAGGFVRVCIRL